MQIHIWYERGIYKHLIEHVPVILLLNMNYINVTVILHIFSLIKNLSKILKVNSIERKFQSQHFFFWYFTFNIFVAYFGENKKMYVLYSSKNAKNTVVKISKCSFFFFTEK